MQYMTVHGETLHRLEREIEYYKILGWSTYGGMTICSRDQYYQTMVGKL